MILIDLKTDLDKTLLKSFFFKCKESDKFLYNDNILVYTFIFASYLNLI